MTHEPIFIPAQDHPFPDGTVVWRKRESVTYLVVIDGPGCQHAREQVGDGSPISWQPGDLIAPVAGQWVPVPEGIDPERLVGEVARWEDELEAHEFTVTRAAALISPGTPWVQDPAGRSYDVARLLVSPETLARITADPDAEPDDPRALIARELGPARADTFLGLLDEHGWTVTRKEER